MLWTLLLLIIFRFGANITAPGVDGLAVAEYSKTIAENGILYTLNIITGGGWDWYPVRYQSYEGFIIANDLRVLTPYVDNPTVIPFGEYVDISRMTIDRLWCYAPEVESWIKAEDISFNQAGKLYNGLGIEVVDLSEVQDWSSISSLADLGIDL